MPTVNEILLFGQGAGANVLTQEEYDALVSRVAGFSSGIARSAELNKVWRQSSFIAAAVAQFVMEKADVDVLDDGDVTVLVTNLTAAITAVVAESLPSNVLKKDVNTPDLTAGFYITPQVLNIVGGTVTPVFTDRNEFTLSVTEAITLANPATIPAGGRALIIATQDATGRALILGSAYRIAGGEWSADPGAVNFLDLTFGGGGGMIDVDISQRGEA